MRFAIVFFAANVDKLVLGVISGKYAVFLIYRPPILSISHHVSYYRCTCRIPLPFRGVPGRGGPNALRMCIVWVKDGSTFTDTSRKARLSPSFSRCFPRVRPCRISPVLLRRSAHYWGDCARNASLATYITQCDRMSQFTPNDAMGCYLA